MDFAPSAQLIYALLLLILVGSALVVRALPIGQMLRMVLAWVGIFALVFLIVSFRPELSYIWNRVKSEVGMNKAEEQRQKIYGETLKIEQARDDHYYININLGNETVPFLVDTGASTTSLSPRTAQLANIDIENLGLPIPVNTANGVVNAYMTVIPSMHIANSQITVLNHPVLISENFGDNNVLGMNFLALFKSWRSEGEVLTLEPYYAVNEAEE